MDFIMTLCPHVICWSKARCSPRDRRRSPQSNRAVLEAYLGTAHDEMLEFDKVVAGYAEPHDPERDDASTLARARSRS